MEIVNTIHNGTENLKKSKPKNSWNQINQFHEKKFFCPKSIFCNFKNDQKSIFELGNRFLSKMEFHENQIDLFDFTRFFFLLF